jgi:hypothetical protein
MISSHQSLRGGKPNKPLLGRGLTHILVYYFFT